MINEPRIVTTNGFQQAWLEVLRLLINSCWELRNIVVHVKDPGIMNRSTHERVSQFAKQERLLGPKHVAYTIFPHRLYKRAGNASVLFNAYNRSNGLYERIHRRKPGWGTYFRRMTHYDKGDVVVNQLGNIMDAVQGRKNISKAAYTVVIQNPGGETLRPLGSPCLNYVAVQIDPAQPMVLGLLAVYRNHDFLERAYGNYWGLCNLLVFLARELCARPGPLTCVSSHAYVPMKRKALKVLLDGL